MAYIRLHNLTPETAGMLLAVRKGKGWTLSRAAEAVDCDLSFIWRLEHSQAAPSVAMATDIVFAYQLNRDQARILMSESVPGVGRSKSSRRKAAAERQEA